jgi:23S rRNA pseudouridine1911/1915/1917 synthase
MEELNPEPRGLACFTADRGDAGHRLDHALVRRLRDISRLSRTRAQAWISAGLVSVDDLVVLRPSTRVRDGSTIRVVLPTSATPRAKPEAESLSIDIVYEDADLLAVNKPAGMVVHPSYRNTSGTLLNAVLAHVARGDDATRPGVVTRLDKETSGLVLVALTSGGHRAIQRDAAGGAVAKTYLAVVSGRPRRSTGTIRLPLGRDPDDRRRMRVLDTGAASETRYEVLDASGAWTLLRCELVTGRTHQIRVHLAASGWPLAGDPVYGVPHPRLARQALHAWTLRMPHPVTRKPLAITAPVSEDLLGAFPEFASTFARGVTTPA